MAQCPYKWGVGSAFHRMKIHIYVASAQVEHFHLFCPTDVADVYVLSNMHNLFFEQDV